MMMWLVVTVVSVSACLRRMPACVALCVATAKTAENRTMKPWDHGDFPHSIYLYVYNHNYVCTNYVHLQHRVRRERACREYCVFFGVGRTKRRIASDETAGMMMCRVRTRAF